MINVYSKCQWCKKPMPRPATYCSAECGKNARAHRDVNAQLAAGPVKPVARVECGDLWMAELLEDLVREIRKHTTGVATKGAKTEEHERVIVLSETFNHLMKNSKLPQPALAAALTMSMATMGAVILGIEVKP